MFTIVSGRTPLRRVLQTTLAVVLVAGVVASIGMPASASSERVLQSVAISVGSDSSIQAISSTAVHATEDDEMSTDSTDLEPTDVADELPVRVLTTYRMGDRSGTDLSEIEGESGRVVIDVTVQNVTARPQRLTYDFAGTQQRTNALVATPMTVVASADLGDAGLGSVVTQDDVNPDDVTNGVLGRSDGSGDVQWAALLAPPRLGASATFRLVQQTDSFQVPTFDLSVQPGLVTDPSVQRLLEAAFAEDPSSTLKLETATIDLVSSVNATLTSATDVLAQIQEALSTSADELGQKTISDLQSSSELVSSSLTSLAGDLDSLNSQMASEMENANAETAAQFRDTVDKMQDLLGNPSEFDSLPTVKSVACGEALPKLRTSGSITEQMIAINAQLRTIMTATDDCKAEITRGLNETIGTLDATADDGTVLGAIEGTRADLADQVDSLETQRDELQRHFDETLLGQFGSKVDRFADLVMAVRNAARRLNNKGTDTDDLPDVETALITIDDNLRAVEGLLNDLESDAGEISKQASIALDLLPADASTDKIVQQVEDQAAAVCAPAPDGTVREDADDISMALAGKTCDDPPETTPAATSVVAQIAERSARVRDVLLTIQQLADGMDAEAIAGQVGTVRDEVATLLENPKLPGRGKLVDLLRSVFALDDGEEPRFPGTTPLQVWPSPKEAIDGLGPGESPSPADCARLEAFDTSLVSPAPDPLPDGWIEPDSLEWMLLFYAKMACNQGGINQSIDEAFNASKKVLAETSDALQVDKDRIDGARNHANEEVGVMVDTLTGALADSASTIRSEGKASVAAQRKQLDAEQSRLAASMDQRVKDAVNRIGSTVSQSTRNLGASEKALLADLDEVLTDLGTRDRNGSGLLGALVKGAADTGAATDTVVRANRAASEFAGVRSTALEDVYLQQAQLSRSLELLEAFPAFGIELPEGSSHLTVFSYRIGAS